MTGTDPTRWRVGHRRRRPRPFQAGGRRSLVAILAVFATVSVSSVALSTLATARSEHRAVIVGVAGRQRTFAVRYVNDVLIVHAGGHADPAGTARLLRASAQVLLDGGQAPAANGDDDETALPPATSPTVRGQIVEEQRRSLGA